MKPTKQTKFVKGTRVGFEFTEEELASRTMRSWSLHDGDKKYRRPDRWPVPPPSDS